MLRLRVLSALIGIPVVIGLLFWGSGPFFLFVAAVSVTGQAEFYRLFRDARPSKALGFLGGLAFPLLALLDGERGLGEAAVFLVVSVLVLEVFSRKKFSSYDASVSVLGPAYISLLLSHLILLRALGPDGEYFVLMVLIGTWVGDISAYFGGKFVGKRKLALSISPGKTWEGVLFGLATTVLVLGVVPLPALDLGPRLLLGLVIGVVSPLGDLLESSFKREADVKDTGSLIPGHGGVLDRFDSLLLTGTASYYLLRFLL